MRLVPEEVLAFLAPEFAARQGELTGYSLDLLEHPAAGWCLRNYLLLTEFPDLLADLRLSEAELFWSRYYWLARYGQVLKAAGPGNGGGVEEELAHLLDGAPDDGDWPLEAVVAAARRDAARQLSKKATHPPPRPRATPVSDAEGLLQDILANPEDDAPRLVYADWLEEHGDADRAAFIRAQIEAARLWQDKALRPALQKQWWKLLEKHRDEWLRDLPAPLRKEVEFQRGFVHWVHCSALEFLRGAERLFRRAPVRSVRLKYATGRVAELAACPYLARLSRINFYAKGNHIDGAGASVFFASPHLGGLVHLELKYNAIGPRGAAALAACPGLAGLRHLELTHNGIGDEGAAVLAAAPHLGNLETLDLYGNDIGDAGAAALAASPHLNRLDFLGLASNQVGPDGVEALAQALGLPALTRLRLAYNPVGDRGAQALLGSPRLGPLSGRLRRLRELDLRSAGVSAAAAAALRPRCAEALYV
jgi:uncharacterized protein (TIGR02996 family)